MAHPTRRQPLDATHASNTAIQKEYEFLDALEKSGTRLTHSVMQPVVDRLRNEVHSDDPRMRGAVVINHDDGSHFYLNYSFYSDLPGGWIIVFTEHQGTLLFSKEELTELAYYRERE